MRNKNSFTSQVKEELASNSYPSDDRLRALLSAYIRINGSLVFRHKKTLLQLNTENAKIGRFIYETINEIYHANAELIVKEKRNLDKSKSYMIEISDASEAIMDDLEISFLEGKISKNIVKNDDTISGYLAGAFLAAGSVNSPVTSNYHLEIALSDEEHARFIIKLLERFIEGAKISTRRGKYIVYLKKAESIADFLRLVGAHEALMKFENVRINRDYSNSLQRLYNCEIANEIKSINAAKKQIETIEKIKEAGKYLSLPEKLRNVAEVRIENQDYSLLEMCDAYQKRYGESISKSGMKHRLNKIEEYASRL